MLQKAYYFPSDNVFLQKAIYTIATCVWFSLLVFFSTFEIRLGKQHVYLTYMTVSILYPGKEAQK